MSDGRKRTPWFNACRQPPVNGGDDAIYEYRCELADYYRTVQQTSRHAIFMRGMNCPYCEWRGLAEKPE